MKATYHLLLMAPDGDYVLEGTNKGYTVDECCELSGRMGSRWIFFPFHFVIKDKGRKPVDFAQVVIEPPDVLQFLKRRTLSTARRYILKYGMEMLENS